MLPTWTELSTFILALVDKVGLAGLVLFACVAVFLALVWFGSKKMSDLIGPLAERLVKANEATAEATTAHTSVLKEMQATSLASAADHKDHDKVARDGRDAAQEGAATSKAILDMLKKEHAA